MRPVSTSFFVYMDNFSLNSLLIIKKSVIFVTKFKILLHLIIFKDT